MQVFDLSESFTQTALTGLVGVTQPAISAMVADGKIPGDEMLGEVLQACCQRLRDQAAGRLGESMGLDLVQERAALARDQLEGALRKACPDLPEEARTTAQQVIAAARNEWIRSIDRTVFDRIDAVLIEQNDGDQADTELDERGAA